MEKRLWWWEEDLVAEEGFRRLEALDDGPEEVAAWAATAPFERTCRAVMPRSLSRKI